MLTNKTTKAKRKLNLSPQTLGVLTSAEVTQAHAAARSTNQTQQASCNQQVAPPPKLNQPPNPVPPIRRP